MKITDDVSYLYRGMGEHPVWNLFKNLSNVFKKDDLGEEIAKIAVPAAMALAADPIASLVDTAFIGRIGSVELAAVGVAIALFNQASKIAIFPLVSVTTSFVAEEDARTETLELEIVENGSPADSAKEKLLSNAELRRPSTPFSSNHTEMTDSWQRKRHNSSASSALFIGVLLGIFQALFLIFAAKPLLKYMGLKSDSPMMIPAEKYLTVRSLGAPAVLLSLSMQGIFRGFKDTKTPLYATMIGDVANILLDPLFIFKFNLGVTGAAIAHVISQYIISLILMWRLMDQIDLLPPSVKDMQFGQFLKNGFLLLMRVIAATSCVTLAASLAARRGTASMAAFQVCLQFWLATSLLADGLAVSGQAILASAFAKHEYDRTTAAASRVLQLGVVLGLVLSVIIALLLRFSSGLFTKDIDVLHLLSLGIPFVAATQPINSLAFVFDGINYGASDFAYSAYSMISVAALSILCLLFLSWSYGFVGIWIALSIFMSLRALVGFWRIGTRTGPWSYLRV